MKSFIKISLLLLLPFFAKAQNEDRQQQQDSLRHALGMASTDASRFKIAMQIAGFYYETNRDSSLHYFEIALPLAEKNNKTLDVARVLGGGKGYQLYHLGKYGEALTCILRSVKIAEDPANEKKIFELPPNVDFRKNRLNILGRVHQHWGFLMGGMQDTVQQMFHYKEAKRIAEEIGDNDFVAITNMNLGGLYTDLGKLDTALLLEQDALANMQKKGTGKTYISSVYRRIGNIYQRQGDTKKAVENWHHSIYWAINGNNSAILARTCDELSSFYRDEKNKDSSLYYARKQLAALKFAESPTLGAAYSNLYKSFELTGNQDSVNFYKGLALQATERVLEDKVKNLAAFQKESFKEQERLQQLEQEKIETKNKLRNYSLFGVLGVFLIIGLLLYRNNRQKRKANKVLQEQKDKVESTLQDLQSTQSQLIQSEKMASLGELTAGIAHEIQNPLNFVNNFSELSKELIQEIEEERTKQKGEQDDKLVDEIFIDIKQNLEKINHHGKRAADIVKGMLQHSSAGSGKKEPTNINALADEYLRLAYHGLRAKDKSFNATMNTDFDETIGNINIIPQDIGRVILNLITNAFYVVNEKMKSGIEKYEPTVSVSTRKGGEKIEIKVADNGNGIPPKILDKIFQPFFTTKPTGQGTGLGLSLSYDIVKAHGGELKVETKENEGTEFIIQIPIF